MARKLSKALRGTSLRKKMEQKMGRNRFSFERMMGGEEAAEETSDRGSFVIAHTTVDDSGACDDDSDLESLSDILGGPYQPQESERLCHATIQPKSALTTVSIPTEEGDNTMINTLQRDDDNQDDEETITEEEIKWFLTDFGDNDTYNEQSTTGSSTQTSTSTKSWKRQIKHLLHPKKHSEEKDYENFSAEEDYPMQEGREFLDHGSSGVVIRCETQKTSNVKSQELIEEREIPEKESDSEDESSEDDESAGNIPPEKQKLSTETRKKPWKVVANAWKRSLKRGKVKGKKDTHLDNISTDSSSSSEIGDFDSFTDDESDAAMAELLEELNAEEGDEPYLIPCGCGGCGMMY